MTRAEIFALIDAERRRQQIHWHDPHAWGQGDCSSVHVPTIVKVAVLTEECGEVARAVLDGNPAQLRAELVQVAAVAVAWVESLADTPAQVEDQGLLFDPATQPSAPGPRAVTTLEQSGGTVT